MVAETERIFDDPQFNGGLILTAATVLEDGLVQGAKEVTIDPDPMVGRAVAARFVTIETDPAKIRGHAWVIPRGVPMPVAAIGQLARPQQSTHARAPTQQQRRRAASCRASSMSRTPSN
jgi:hypothetical protein